MSVFETLSADNSKVLGPLGRPVESPGVKTGVLGDSAEGGAAAVCGVRGV
jgi:hypothetical protein